jgi:hypothetical protein
MGEAVRAVRVRLIGCVVGVAVAVVAAAGLVATPAHAYTCPGSPSPIWGCPAFGAGKYDGLFNWRPSVTVIGDSLIQNLGSSLANQLTSTQQFWGHTTGIGGSSFFHWNNEIDGRDLFGWVDEFDPKHSVIALGTNDASKLGSDSRVSRADIAAQIGWGMERAWQGTQRCVIVVGPSRHNASPSSAAYVRERMAFYVWTRYAEKPAGHRFVWFDWDAHSASHPEWFNGPNDPHMTPSGKSAYIAAITYVAAATDYTGC